MWVWFYVFIDKLYDFVQKAFLIHSGPNIDRYKLSTVSNLTLSSLLVIENSPGYYWNFLQSMHAAYANIY